MTSNCTFLMASGVVPNPTTPQVAAYFEGTNILVYIRGKADDHGRWWSTASTRHSRHTEKGLTLVNAHYDSYVPCITSSGSDFEMLMTFQGFDRVRRHG